MTIWGVRDLREIQIKFSTTLPPAATWNAHQVIDATSGRIVGKCGMKKIVNRVFPTEATGVMSDHIIKRYYDPWVMAELPIATGDEGLTFQQFPWYLAMGALGGATIGPVAGVWTFTPALTAADMPQVATIRYGDNALAWYVDCCFARQLVISGAFQGPWNLEADIVGKDMIEDGVIGSIDIPYDAQLETILGQLTVLNVAADCTFTPAPKIAGKLIDWRITIPGFHPKFFQDGHLNYSVMGLASRHLTFEATVEWDSAWAAAEHAIWEASHAAPVPSVPRYFQLAATGGIPVLPPPPPAAYSAIINMVLMYESFETLDQRDGNDIVKFVARTAYDIGPCVGGTSEWQIIVGNAELALP